MTDYDSDRLRAAEAKVAQFEQDARDRAKAREAFNYQVLVAIIGSGVMLLVPRFLH